MLTRVHAELKAGPRSGGRPDGGAVSTSAYSPAKAAKGGSPSSGGRENAGPSAAKVMRPSKSFVPSASVVPVSARPASVSSVPAIAATAGVAAAAAEPPVGEDH